MAGKQQEAPDNEKNRGAAEDRPASKGLVEGLILGAAAAVAAVWNAVTADGHLEAAARQGVDELGVALKAFPESIQVQEHGTLWHPTQGEIAADRDLGRDASSGGSRQPWPSEIAEANRHLPAKDHGNGHENGHDAGYSM